MATLKQIQFKRSKTAGARPAASVLAEGELAINLKDRVLFTKDDQGNIIDLGFAKGGSIDGNVIHIGNYNQTGDYTLNGAFTQTGNFNLTGIARVTRDIIAAGQIMTEGGELITKSSGTAHVRFFDGNNRERGIIYAPANDGLTTQVLNIRVQDYAAGDESTYAFSGSGLFTSPEVSAWKSISSPQILTDKVITDGKKTGDYDISSLANNNSDTDKNYLRIVRTDPAAAMLHEICENNGISWYSGSTPTDYMLSFSYSGGLQAGHSIAVGMESSPMTYSALGKGSIAIGDNDTGFKWHQDGYFHAVNNGTRTFIYGPAETQSLRKMVMGYSPDGILMTTPPTENYALATVVTYHDNNAYGDGQTLLGYYQGGNYHHYFRGKGTTNINTHGGLLVTPGNIDVIGGSVNIDGRNNNSILMFKGYTMGQSSVDNMYIAVWGNTFTNPSEGTRKNVMEISDDIGWMHYIQRTTAGKIESVINGTQIVNENFTVVKNATFDGTISAAGEIATNAVNGLRIWNADYGAIFRRSEGSLHIIPTAYGEGKHGDIGPLRPFSMALDTGKVTIPDLQSSYNTFAANGYIKFVGHGAGAGGYDIQYVQAAPIFQEIDDDAVNKYYPIVKQKYLQGKAVWSLGTEINSGTFVIHHIKEDGTQGHTSRFNADGTVNFPDNVLVGGDINMKGLMTFDAGRLGSRDYFKFNHWGDSNNARDNIIQLEDSQGAHFSTERTLATGAIKTRFFGETFTDGTLYLNQMNNSSERFSINNWGNSEVGRAAVLEVGDSKGYHFYAERRTDNSLMFDVAGSLTVHGPSGITIKNSTGARHIWFRDDSDAEKAVIWATDEGILHIRNNHGGSFSHHFQGAMIKAGEQVPYNSEYALIRGDVFGGAWDDWRNRPAGILLDCQDSHTRAYSIWKATHWGVDHLAAMGVHAVGGQATVMMHMNKGGWYSWTANGDFISSASVYCNDVYIRSDRRLKINVEDYEENAVDKVNKLKVKTYDKVKSLSDREVIAHEIGIIAQDLQEILPEAVSTSNVGSLDNPEEILTISNSTVNALLIKAIQEMSEEIKELKTPLFTKIARKISKYFKF
ncbi:long tail fiber protein distal subunit [Escherichia phage vB_EcoM_NBG2]|uniref:Long tail fiber protein Gp37 n=1 Tax=Escherichia phage vB_EcoM_NBG2 TaxID=2184699 RepID=A0A2U8QPQ9_9CAUD|nr:long tail fiber protein distal subunit [Escherichia phage vB_EcoM_NBG2]AWM11962.1 long tail fiber distal subunit [Escherichia phage vB_EcoM_NBG2]